MAARLLLALATVSYAGTARAQPRTPNAQELETARSLFREGKDLRARGDLQGALGKFSAAHALGDTPVTGIELARTYVLVRQLVEARSLCLLVARMPIAADETAKSADARTEAAALADELKARIPTLVVEVQGLAPGETAHVVIDGVQVPEPAASEPQKLDPGTHEVSASAGPLGAMRESHGSATLEEGEAKRVTLSLPPAATQVPAPVPTVTPELPAPQSRHAWPVVAKVGFATGLTGAAAGLLAGALALEKKGRLGNECSATKQCDSSRGGSGDLADAESWATVSTVAVSVGAAGLVVSGVALLLAPANAPRPREQSLAPWVGAGVVGVHGRF